MYARSVVLFRRDLRLFDNTAFCTAAKNSKQVIPLFIFDERQVGSSNAYRSQRAVQFMVESLEDLEAQLSAKGGCLHALKGSPATVLSKVIEALGVDAVFLNEDVTPFSRSRDEKLRGVCEEAGAHFVSCHDLFLTRPGSVRTQQGTPYQVFTPFMRAASEFSVARPSEPEEVEFFTGDVPGAWPAFRESLIEEELELFVHGGRARGLALLDDLSELADYVNKRNVPAVRGTSGLSAHHKFGTVSVRETYYRVRELFGVSHKLISELYWRDFYSHLVFDYPELLTKKVAFKKKYRGVSWREDDKQFRAWCAGLTGYPLVDAGMRELNNTGYMHNRVRMVVASFLCKDLRLDWRLGERYFAQQLTDYDPAVNNGSWQWAASTGCDAQPYFRIFNPVSQQKKYDPEAVYIKRWVAELRGLSAKQIHKLVDTSSSLVDYPAPIVDHAQARAETLAWFKEL